MAGASDRGQQGNPQQGSHPRMGAGLPQGGGQPTQGQGGVGDTIRQAASSVSETAGHMKERAQEMASQAAGRLGDAWESTREGVRQGASMVAERAGDFWTDATNLIRRYPVASVCVAFALGCLTPACLRATFGWGEDDMAERMSRSSA